MLYPVELRAPSIMVGAARFELAASWTQTRRATKLRHAPTVLFYELQIYDDDISLSSLSGVIFRRNVSRESRT